MHLRVPFCASISALIFVTLVPHERGGPFEDTLVRASFGLIAGAAIGAALELHHRWAARRLAATARRTEKTQRRS